VRRKRGLLIAVAAVAVALAFYVAFFALPQESGHEETYTGPQGTIFLRFDSQHRLVEFGTKSGNAKAKLLHPNGVSTLCVSRSCDDPKGYYWTEIYYFDKNGVKLWKKNTDRKTNHFPSPTH